MVEDFSPPPSSNQELQVRVMQYLFRSGTRYTVMVHDSYEQIEVSASQLGNQVEFLKEGLDGISGTFWEGSLIAINLPDKVELELVQTEHEQVGSRILLMGTLETGAKIELPRNSILEA